MIRNSQFSHILLLVVIGFAIYYLTSPSKENKPIKNIGTLESKDSNIKNNSDSENNSQVESEVTESPVKNKAVEKISQEVEPEDTEDNSKGIISEVEEEIENNYSNKMDDNNQSQTTDQINSFKPNSTEGGANLDKAFNRPIPDGSQTNAINFNKNYLKSYDSKSYLPQEINDEWFDTDFTQAKNKLNSDNLINTEKYVIGIDTVGQSLKNASWDLRGTVANPKYNVSPWLNSTYEPDYNIKPLC